LPFEPFEPGGMGHGLGLRMCEPPSIAPRENTIAETGMALTNEPGVIYIEPSMDYQIDVGGDLTDGAPARSRQTGPPQTAIARR
jgi:Xaa-Pro dipeptidase